jgi:hypothetical protein
MNRKTTGVEPGAPGDGQRPVGPQVYASMRQAGIGSTGFVACDTGLSAHSLDRAGKIEIEKSFRQLPRQTVAWQ